VPAAAWVPLVGAQTAVLLSAALIRRWWATRRPHLLAWSVSLAAFTVGIGALAYGEAFGFSAPVFRTYYLSGALLAAPWLGLGQVQLLARPSLGRWARDLTVGFSTVAAFILGFAPLRAAVPATHVVPDGTRLYGALPLALVAVSNVAGTVAVLAGIAVSGWRSRNGGRPARIRFIGTIVIGLGVALFATAGSLARAGSPAGTPVLLSAGVAVMYVGFVLTQRPVPGPGRHRGGSVPPVLAARITVPAARITLLGKPGCHLCEQARADVARIAAELGVTWGERSVLEDPALQREYADYVPVIFVDGRVHGFWRVEESRLRRELAAPVGAAG